MKIMLDTNVLISASVFQNKQFDDVFEEITNKHNLFLSAFVVDEFLDVMERKFPSKRADADVFLSRLSFELVRMPKQIQPGLFEIRDPKDYPVLYIAMIEGVDILITGDKDFISMRESVEAPEILTVAEFAEKYM